MSNTEMERLQARLDKANADRAVAEAAENKRLDDEWLKRGKEALEEKVAAAEAATASYRKSAPAPTPSPSPNTQRRSSGANEE